MTKKAEQKSFVGTLTAFSIITILVFIKELTIPFGLLDELWCYTMSRGIAMGFLPYRDYDMVQMPFCAFVFSVPLMISRTLIMYRIASSVFLSALFCIVYRIIREETKHEYALPAALLGICIIDIVTYNTMMFIMVLLIYLFNKKEASVKKNIILGILAACAALSRQTSGSLMIVAELIVVIMSADKKEKKGLLKSVGTYIAGLFIPCLVFLGYLLATSSFFDFWDNCLFSLFGFGSKYNHFFSGSIPLIILVLIGIAADIALYKKDKDMHRIYHLILGVPLILVAVPIVDFMHMIFSAIWFIIPISAAICVFAGKQLTKKIYLLSTVAIFIAEAVVSIAGVQNCGFTDKYPELKCIPTDLGLIELYGGLADSNAELRAQGYKVDTISFSYVVVTVMEDRFDENIFIYDRGFTLVEPEHPEYYREDGTFSTLAYAQGLCEQPGELIVISEDYYNEGWGTQSEAGVYDYIAEHCVPVRRVAFYTYYQPVEE